MPALFKSSFASYNRAFVFLLKCLILGRLAGSVGIAATLDLGGVSSNPTMGGEISFGMDPSVRPPAGHEESASLSAPPLTWLSCSLSEFLSAAEKEPCLILFGSRVHL